MFTISIGQNKAPVTASNGPFQPSGSFQPGPHGANWRHLNTPPQSSANMNGFPAQYQQSRMPVTSPVPQPPPHVYQTPNLHQQRPPGQGSFPSPPAQSPGTVMNGPGNTNVRPPVTSSLPPSSGFAQPLRAGYGMTPPQSGNQAVRSPEPPPPLHSLPPPSSVPYSAGVQGSAGDSPQSKYFFFFYLLEVCTL